MSETDDTAAQPGDDDKLTPEEENGFAAFLSAVTADAPLLKTEREPTQIIHGSALQQMRQMTEEYVRPLATTVSDPVSGTRAAALITPNGISATPAAVFDDYLERPRFRRGIARMTSVDSFIEHVNRFKDEGSAVFANDDRAGPSLQAVIDYHPEGSDDAVAPRFGKHRTIFDFPVSDEWKVWTGQTGKVMAMVEFAAFLEDHINDVLHMITGEDEISEDVREFIARTGGNMTIASPSQLFDLARNLQVNENSVVREVLNLSSGEGQVLFNAEHSDAAGAPLKVPGLFMIGIPVFRNGPIYRLPARLRYRKKEGRILFWFDLWRTDRTFDAAFDETLVRVGVDTGLPVFRGQPEV